MPTVAIAAATETRTIDVALLGCGVIGSAIARARDPRVRIRAALVRDLSKPRGAVLPGALLTDDPQDVLAARPDVIVELLGGIEPARTLVSGALASGIPVVTANKSLLAAHGDELLELSAATGTPLRYEAAVLAGVPFLGIPGQRVHAFRLTGLTGIVNGTSNFILTRMRDGRVDCAVAVAEAQRLGLAEPDPRNDIDGVDAAEKLAVVLRHYACASIDPRALERTGIAALRADDLEHAAEFGGVIKAVAIANRSGDVLRAFVGPALLPAAHKLARIDGAENGLIVRNGYGALVFCGPGAGPEPTAASVLDDVLEIGAGRPPGAAYEAPPSVTPIAPETEWFVRLSGTPALPDAADICDLLGAHGVWLRRCSEVDSRTGWASRWLLTLPVERARIERALGALRAASGCDANALRAVEAE